MRRAQGKHGLNMLQGYTPSWLEVQMLPRSECGDDGVLCCLPQYVNGRFRVLYYFVKR